MSAGTAEGAPRIVVGVDGSPSSRAALRWAVRQARLTGGTVDAVIAWQIPAVLASSGWAPIYVEEEGDFEKDARKTIEATIGEEVDPADSALRLSARPRSASAWPGKAGHTGGRSRGPRSRSSRGHGCR